MATVKFTGPVRYEVERTLRAPYEAKITAAHKAAQGRKISMGNAAYDTLMPAEHKSHWEALPDEFRHGLKTPTLYINFVWKNPAGETRWRLLDFPLSVKECLAFPILTAHAKLFEEQMVRTNLTTDNRVMLMAAAPAVYRIIETELDSIAFLLDEADKAWQQMQTAMDATVTMNRLLKVSPGVEKLMPPSYVGMVRKPRAMLTSADNNWKPDDLQTEMLKSEVITS